MPTLRLILADQLSQFISALWNANKATDLVMLCEVMTEATYVKHHKKKIAFLFAAMRHFADELKAEGFNIRYVKLTDADNTGSFEGEVKRAIAEFNPSEIVVTEPGEYRVLEIFKLWQTKFSLPVEIRPDDRFLCSHVEFNNWAGNKQSLRMEYFYREMRKRYNILIEQNGKPTGGKWNYDKQNRKPPAKGLYSPKRISHKKSAITKEVLQLVEDKFSSHFGTLQPFHYAVTRTQALKELQHFITHLLPNFGTYQDAMVAGEPYLFHSLLSSYINAGLLLPLEICKLAEAAYRNGKAPLNAVEGFIRQILGWREFIRGVYWLRMPEYKNLNYLGAKNPLPWFYWSAETKMFCVAEAVRNTRDHAYSHHIQRLMITGNFALIAELDPIEVCEWYLIVYSDAYEWVELPNTLGLGLFGDGGMISSKPYAASGKYINRMSNFCKTCEYDPEITVGEKACPFNSLYWDFLVRNENKLRSNNRIPYVYSTWEKMEGSKKIAILNQAKNILIKMRGGSL